MDCDSVPYDTVSALSNNIYNLIMIRDVEIDLSGLRFARHGSVLDSVDIC